ncbi:unnamed protein product [Acanthoscelides obtectus]|uniref:Uncharacterized protein n=1 Tax=Acanthoscelides obtectus TaxID=200917 RepID=A0A9P0KGH7_ACAOB|nr:unnamed protein product [Acanthoscelides obtectus]CAK1651050.1 hypothetical protein AOBTE_LOCUS17031 [Acanthoscelides obtectus]
MDNRRQISSNLISARESLAGRCHRYPGDLQVAAKIIASPQRVYELDQRHTSEYLGQCLSSICEEWNISDLKITTVVTDNGANIVKAVSDLFGKNRHLPCFAHTLDLVASKITDSEDVKPLVVKVKSIVTYFKQSMDGPLRMIETIYIWHI